MKTISATVYNSDNDNYPKFEQCVKNTFKKAIENNEPLFTTDVSGLYDLYLNNLPEEARQHYTCTACRHFIERYGGLVTISDTGITTSAIWSEEVPTFFKRSILSMKKAVESAKVNGVFMSIDAVLGTPVTGEWTHLSIELPSNRLFIEKVNSLNAVIAEKKTDFPILMSGIIEYPIEAVEQAYNLLNTEALYRSEKVLGVASWLLELHRARNLTANKKLKDNIVWKAVATAPPGFCHIKSTMIGTLLDDIVAGIPFETVCKRFSEKMNPVQYQRPQAAPTTGNIKRAEEIVKKLGIEQSLDRRFARIEEVKLIWKPEEEAPREESGVFSHLKAKDNKEIPKMETPAVKITWKKFSDTVLPTAKSIEYSVNFKDGFSAILTANNYDAPPIIQWDVTGNRNPFSHYMYQGDSTANQWNLDTGLCKVTGICHEPSMWSDGFEHHGKAVFFLLDGAKDREYKSCGNSLFPEILKSELREIRSTIEAYSRSAEILGYEEASACGIRLQGGLNWNARVKVYTEFGIQNYVLDRWD